MVVTVIILLIAGLMWSASIAAMGAMVIHERAPMFGVALVVLGVTAFGLCLWKLDVAIAWLEGGGP